MSVLESGDFKDYVAKRVEKSGTALFCPFRDVSVYCNDLYTGGCYRCVYALDEYVCFKNTEVNVFDEVEVHENCTVQILKNSVTGKTSVGWWENEHFD